ncbi:MAG: hypothetical protein AUI47_00820 [Acidobacteria bacterium 13_1_40CM_2_68_5]|nr:MAG: hypothetical protein AUI47_00820 [Acidobacteria bacterium 13_1_40CM_2_68_5]
MLEATLRTDGSVADVVCALASETVKDSSEERLVCLDGLPRLRGRPPSVSIAESDLASWTGGFSFVIWNRTRETLHAYRDHYGARALYYREEPGRLILSSELPTILDHLPSAPPIDEAAAAEYVVTGVLSENRTFHQGIHRLPAASRLSAGRGGLRIERYWRPWTGPWRGDRDPTALDEEFRRLFRAAVAETLAAPGPVGVLLSGGPDSSAVLGMAARLGREAPEALESPRAALTMVFDAVRQCDEGTRAQETAVMHGVPWRPVRVEDRSPLYGLDDFLLRFGEPPCSVNLALEAILLDTARREGIIALLDGHDADALFTPSAAYLAALLRDVRWGRLASELVSLKRDHKLPLRRLIRSTIAPLVPAAVRRLRHRAPAWIRPDVARRTGLEERLRTHPPKAEFQEAEADRILAPSVGLALEVTRCLERMHGVEGRHPFFDADLVRFVLSLPLEARYRSGKSKILLRRALADLLTPASRSRIDKTNYTPYLDWSLRTHLGSRLAALAERGSVWLDPYVEWRHARPMIAALLAGRPSDRMAIWRLVALERWLMLRSGQQVTQEVPHETPVA